MLANAAGFQGRVRERHVVLFVGIRGFGQIGQHRLFCQPARGSLVVHGPATVVPDEPFTERRTVAQAVTELQDQALGVARVVPQLLQQAVGALGGGRLGRTGLRFGRHRRRHLECGSLLHDGLKLLALAAGLDRVPQIALGWQAGQMDDLHFAHVRANRFGDNLPVLLALVIVINDDPDHLAEEGLRVFAAPLSLAVGRACGHDAEIGGGAVGRLLAVYDEYLVGRAQLVQPVKDRNLAGLLPRDPTAVGRERILAKRLIVLPERCGDA